MFDVGASELLLIIIVAVVVIGPKDMPMALRTAGRWIGKVRRVSGHFRSGLENMIREAELEEMERKWREQNEAIMKAHPEHGADPAANPAGNPEGPPAASAEAALMAPLPAASVPALPPAPQGAEADPQLPLPDAPTAPR